MKAWLVKISGAYNAQNGDLVDFNGIEGIIPACKKDAILSYIQSRYAQRWLMEDREKFPARWRDAYEVFLESAEEVEHNFSFVGKNILDMTMDEIQDLATANDLMTIPAPRMGTLIETQRRAYAEYSKHVLDNDLGKLFAFSENTKPIIADGDLRIDESEHLTNDEVLEMDAAPKEMTLEQAKALAKSLGIPLKGNPSLARVKELIKERAKAA